MAAAGEAIRAGEAYVARDILASPAVASLCWDRDPAKNLPRSPTNRDSAAERCPQRSLASFT
jgi:hypothetical protein